MTPNWIGEASTAEPAGRSYHTLASVAGAPHSALISTSSASVVASVVSTVRLSPIAMGSRPA